jgi:hypothetical protein
VIDHKTPLTTIDRPPNADDVVRCIVANCMQVAGSRLAEPGLSAGNPETFDAFHDLMPPGMPGAALKVPFQVVTKPDGTFQTKGVSTCACVADGIRRRMGVQAPYLYATWKNTLVRDAIDAATLDKAWHDAWNQSDLSPKPEPGAYIIIGCRTPGESNEGKEHVLTAMSWPEEDVLESCDGGQCDMTHRGLQCAKLRRRRFVLRKGRPWLVDIDKPAATAPGRRVLGWIVPELQRYASKLVVPEGWDVVEL